MGSPTSAHFRGSAAVDGGQGHRENWGAQEGSGRSKAVGSLTGQVIFKSILQSSGQGGGPGRRHGRLGFPVPQPSRPRLAPEFPLRAAGAECPGGFHSQTPGLPRWAAGLGQGRESQAGCPNLPGLLPGASAQQIGRGPWKQGRLCGGGDQVWRPQLPVPSAGCAPPPCAHPTPAQICFSSKQPAPPLRLQMAQEGHDPDVSPCLSAHDATANTWVRSAPGPRKPLRDRGAGADATAVLRMRGRECRPRPLCRGTAVHLPPPPLTALGGGRNDRPQATAHPQVPGTSQRTRGMVLVNWTRHGTTVHQRFLQKGEGKD